MDLKVLTIKTNHMKTSKDYTVHFKVDRSDYGMLTVPKGTKLTHNTAMGVDKNYHFVDEFDWVKPYPDGLPKHALLFDLKHYGINVPKEYVEY
jgi:hypothetical protein